MHGLGFRVESKELQGVAVTIGFGGFGFRLEGFGSSGFMRFRVKAGSWFGLREIRGRVVGRKVHGARIPG